MLTIDSKFYAILVKIADLVILSLLWILFSLPVVTVGASSTALYYCIVKVVRQDRGRTVRSFWDSFRGNFKQSTLVTLGALAATVVVYFAGVLLNTKLGVESTAVYFIYLLFLVFGVAWLQFLFSYIARFANSTKLILRNSFLLTLTHLPHSVVLAALTIAAAVGFILLLPQSLGTLLFLPAVCSLLSSFLLENVYKKHLPEPQEKETGAEEGK